MHGNSFAELRFANAGQRERGVLYAAAVGSTSSPSSASPWLRLAEMGSFSLFSNNREVLVLHGKLDWCHVADEASAVFYKHLI